MRSQDPVLPRRRAIAALIAVGASAAAACTHRNSAKDLDPTGSAAPSGTRASSGAPKTAAPIVPDPAVIAAAQARELALIAAYDKAARTAPALESLLEAFRAHHLAHLQRISSVPGAPADPPPGAPTATPTRPSSPAPSAGTVAKTRAALAEVAQVEAVAAADGAGACAKAGPADFAVLLAEIAGCEAQHAALLPTFPVPS